MVQIISPSPRAMQAGQIGQALGIGVGKNFPDPQQMVQQEMLQKALNKMPENASYLDTLKAIGPQLLTTPGGAQLLEAMGPILQKQASSKALADYYAQKTGQGEVGAQQIPGQEISAGVSQRGIKPEGEQYFRDPKPPVGSESTKPQQTAGPQPVPLMTPQEQNQRRQELNLQYAAQGTPANPSEIENVIQMENQSRMQYNAQIEQERQTREAKQKDVSQRLLTRFENANVSKSPEDATVFEKFANDAPLSDNENQMYQYARTRYNQFENARNGLIREAQIPNKLEKLWQGAIGTYKQKENVIKDLQPHLKKLKDLGLEQQARSILSNEVGLGMEDVELAMYPPSSAEKSFYDKMPPNPFAKKQQGLSKGFPSEEPIRFPGDESALPEDRYNKFKDEVASFVEKNPGANLVALRGVLNQDKKYGWPDISRAVSELIDEGRFQPDLIQEQQLNVIKSPPIPGLGAMFKEFWKGTK